MIKLTAAQQAALEAVREQNANGEPQNVRFYEAKGFRSLPFSKLHHLGLTTSSESDGYKIRIA